MNKNSVIIFSPLTKIKIAKILGRTGLVSCVCNTGAKLNKSSEFKDSRLMKQCAGHENASLGSSTLGSSIDWQPQLLHCKILCILLQATLTRQ